MWNHRLSSCTTITILTFLILCCCNPRVKASNGEEEQDTVDIRRSDFPDGFLFGTATSSYQIEGGQLEDGRGLCNWDVFCQIKGSIADGDIANIADDHYHRYMEDIEILSSLGVNAYRFSISWSRVLPRGKFGEVNEEGILFYNKIIDNLINRGIEPFVTIHHFDYPQELEDRYGGWLSPLMQYVQFQLCWLNCLITLCSIETCLRLCRADFVHFAEICFRSYGDRVKYWSTINEPNLYSEFAYERGTYPPARCSPPFGNCSAGNSDVEPLIAMHNMLLGHAKAVKLYRDCFQSEQRGVIGIVVHSFMYKPLTSDRQDKEAADRAMAFNIAWVLDPVVFGDYPREMRRYHGSELPKFTSKERMLLRDSIDFMGINHYATLYATDCIYSICICNDTSCTKGSDRAIRGFVYTTAQKDGIPIGEPTGMDRFFVVPQGMEEIVEYAKKRYHNKPMIITENGYSTPRNQVDDDYHDVKRVNYHKSYLAFLARAMRNGADVRGYFLWTLMNDFEWSNGYSVKFGIYQVDPQTLHRTPKLSANWFKSFLSNSSLNHVHSRKYVSLMSKDVSRHRSE